jgi:hypothetical protein
MVSGRIFSRWRSQPDLSLPKVTNYQGGHGIEFALLVILALALRNEKEVTFNPFLSLSICFLVALFPLFSF